MARSLAIAWLSPRVQASSLYLGLLFRAIQFSISCCCWATLEVAGAHVSVGSHSPGQRWPALPLHALNPPSTGRVFPNRDFIYPIRESLLAGQA